MPKIVDKVQCLNGCVLLYGSGTSSGKWFYREWDSAATKYRQKQIPGAASVDEAVRGAIDVAFVIKQKVESQATLPFGKSVTRASEASLTIKKVSTNSRSRTKTQGRETITHAVEQFIAAEQEKVLAGLLDKTSDIRQVLRLHGSISGV